MVRDYLVYPRANLQLRPLPSAHRGRYTTHVYLKILKLHPATQFGDLRDQQTTPYFCSRPTSRRLEDPAPVGQERWDITLMGSIPLGLWSVSVFCSGLIDVRSLFVDLDRETSICLINRLLDWEKNLYSLF